MDQHSTEPDLKTVDIQPLQAFFAGYRALHGQAVISQSAAGFIDRFNRLRDEYLALQKETREREPRQAPHYNIFQILGVARAEVRTHSAFLAHLLSPTASHGQGFLFLESFLRHCASHYPGFPMPAAFTRPQDWVAVTEEHFHSGRMDIVIQNPRENFLCVVENKVDSGEGRNQLARYGRWLDEHDQAYPRHALCYLTIAGDEPVSAGSTPVYQLSYHKDIAIWIEDILDQIQAPGVRAVVHQYQAVARSL
jgi:hypothetical protein